MKRSGDAESNLTKQDALLTPLLRETAARFKAAATKGMLVEANWVAANAQRDCKAVAELRQGNNGKLLFHTAAN